MILTDRVQTALGARYRLVRELGAGGMATVFLATDLKHSREVAIKVLRSDLAAVLGVERFLAEVKISAGLDHPHILTLIDSGEADGILYYVMPFVRGESLRAQLNREKQLGIDEALSITKQVASALDYAHARGVVHRDIKPENILIHEGVAVLADFGIALAVKEAGGDRLTETGLSLGTPSYMSPEQATGDRALDARSDVYSLAAVLYEMLCGESPVTGATAQAMIAKLLTEKPASLRVVRDTVTPALDAAVLRALNKVPADRFKSAGELARAAELAMQPATTAVPVPNKTRRAVVLAVALAVVIAGAWFGRDLLRGGATPFAGAVMTPLTTSGRAMGGVASPDGSQLAYTEMKCENGVCRGDLMIREMNGEGVAAIVAEPNKMSLPFSWSPDGRWVLMGMLDLAKQTIEGIQIVSQRGGIPRRVTNTISAAFVANDTLVVLSDSGPPHWLRRQVASTGTVVDSVRVQFPRSAHYVLDASASGRWLTGTAIGYGGILIFDRAGRITDTLAAEWQGNPTAWDPSTRDAVLMELASSFGAAGGAAPARVLVRRRVDGRGRLAPAETLAVYEPSARFSSLSTDGSQLFFEVTRAGETTLWTATRRDLKSEFTVGRVLGSGTNQWFTLSPRGGWILRQEAASGSNRGRIEFEPFTGGARTTPDPSLTAFREGAFSPRDDSIAIATDEGSNRMVVTLYPLPAGTPVRVGPFEANADDLEWLSDGSLASPLENGRAVRVFGRDGQTRDLPFPDSLGTIENAARSPSAPELALLSEGPVTRDANPGLFLSRMNLTTGAVTLITHVPTLNGLASRVWWNTDGNIRFVLRNPVARASILTRVPVAGGALEEEPPLTFAPNGVVEYLSQDGLRAIVSSRSYTTDVAVMRAPGRAKK